MKHKKRIKWITDGVNFRRGNHTPLIAKFDNSKYCLSLRAGCTTATFKADIRRLAQDFEAQEIIIKPAYIEDETGNFHKTENEVIGFLYIDEKAIFSVDLPVPDGSCRKIRYYEPEEVFITTKNYIELCPPDTCPPLNTSIFKKNNKRHVDDPDDF